MSYWNTAKKDNDEYVVIRHKIPKFNGFINGIRFREGYGVVIKNSKIYSQVKKLPLIKGCEEYPLIHLRQLKFIPRDREIETIFGKDVYKHFMSIKTDTIEQEVYEEKQQEIKIHLEESNLCKHKTKADEYCKMEYFPHSPSYYCKRHIIEDPTIEEVTGYKIPKMMSKKEKKDLKNKILNKLEKLRPNKDK